MKKISDQLQVNNLKLRNRLVLPALTTNAANNEGEVTGAVINFYKERAGSVGLVIVEATAIRPDGRLVPDSLGLWKDSQVAGMAQLVETIKAAGASVVVQLNHAGARCIPDKGALAGASPSGFQFRPDLNPLILSEKQIELLVNDFADAAGRAIVAGFDGVEIHGAHFYLLSQFISPFTNKRQDQFGSGEKGRAKFPLEVVKAVRKKIGEDHSILFRLNAVEGVDGGLTLDESSSFSQLLAAAGVDMLDVSFAGEGAWQEIKGNRYFVFASTLSKSDPPGANINHAAHINKITGLPVISVGKLWNRAVVEEALKTGHIDLVAIGRQMIADPDAAVKILRDHCEEISICTECANCFTTIRSGLPVDCPLW